MEGSVLQVLTADQLAEAIEALFFAQVFVTASIMILFPLVYNIFLEPIFYAISKKIHEKTAEKLSLQSELTLK